MHFLRADCLHFVIGLLVSCRQIVCFLPQKGAASTIQIKGLVATREAKAKDYSLTYKSELMEDVPVGAVNRHRYALIIGNEDYSMTGANATYPMQ